MLRCVADVIKVVVVSVVVDVAIIIVSDAKDAYNVHMCVLCIQRCDAAKGSADDHFNQKAMLLADRLLVNISNCVDCWDYGRPE